MSVSCNSPKKILFLTPRIPYPPLKGDQAVAYHRLRTLSTRHEITLLTFVEGVEDPGADEALGNYCKRIIRVPHPRWRMAWNLLTRGIWSREPLQVLYYNSPAFRKQLEALLLEDFDLVHGFMLRMLPYLKDVALPVVLECIDSMRLNMSRQAEAASGLMRWIYLEELRRMHAYEPAMDQYINNAIFVSPIDAKHSGSAKAQAIPLGVTIPKFKASCEAPTLAFSGNMGYGPNILAATWFVKNCWVSIRRKFPQATFRILGGGAPSEIRALGGEPGVEVCGSVADMAEALSKAGLAVAPMQSGSGMQFKILEAMACGLPVVASSLGRGAIEASPDQGLWVADGPNAMIESVCALLSDAELRRNLGGNGRTFVKAHHSWEHAAEVLEETWIQTTACELLG